MKKIKNFKKLRVDIKDKIKGEIKEEIEESIGKIKNLKIKDVEKDAEKGIGKLIKYTITALIIIFTLNISFTSLRKID